MTTNAHEIRVVIRVEMTREDVYSDSLRPLRFVIADYDMADGADDSELVTLATGDQFVALESVTSLDDFNYVAEVFAAIDNEVPKIDNHSKPIFTRN